MPRLLHKACESGLVSKAFELINAGHETVRTRDSVGRTPLHVACQRGRLNVVRLQLGMPVVTQDGEYQLSPRLAVPHGAIQSEPFSDNFGNTPLHTAARAPPSSVPLPPLPVPFLPLRLPCCHRLTAACAGGRPCPVACPSAEPISLARPNSGFLWASRTAQVKGDHGWFTLQIVKLLVAHGAQLGSSGGELRAQRGTVSNAGRGGESSRMSLLHWVSHAHTRAHGLGAQSAQSCL